MKSTKYPILFLLGLITFVACKMPTPPPTKSTLNTKHNYIILLDLSDRLIVQENQPARDKEIINKIYGLFEEHVKKELYIRSRDEIKVVIAKQKGSGISYEEYEDKLFFNIEDIPTSLRRKKEEERKEIFTKTLDTLYQQATRKKNPEDYYGADIWKYFYEDLKTDYSTDTLTKNFLFILTDGYPVVGKNIEKLPPVNKDYSDLKVVLIEAAPREKDMEWDRIQEIWQEWFDEMKISDYQFIKRMALSKEVDIIKDLTEK